MRFSRSASPVPLAALVMPLPARLAPKVLHGSSVAPKSALVLVRDLDARAAPNAPWLNTLFGLTEAEAIAVARGTSAMTVRKQVRSILEKSGAASLRELTRLFTALPERGP